MILKKLPDVVGFYLPASRETDYTGLEVNRFTGEVTRPPSMTKQEFVAECDINNIIKEFLHSGQVQHISAKAAQGAFLDLPPPMDFQESIHIVMRAEAAFAELPSRVREKFGNDPEAFLAFMSDPANAKEAEELGLTKTPPQPISVAVASMPAPPAPPAEQSGPKGGQKAPE